MVSFFTQQRLNVCVRVKYSEGESVHLWENKIGPNRNPQETYTYRTLPWCMPSEKSKIDHKFDGIGSLWEGNELVDSGIVIQFKSMMLPSHYLRPYTYLTFLFQKTDPKRAYATSI